MSRSFKRAGLFRFSLEKLIKLKLLNCIATVEKQYLWQPDDQRMGGRLWRKSRIPSSSAKS